MALVTQRRFPQGELGLRATGGGYPARLRRRKDDARSADTKIGEISAFVTVYVSATIVPEIGRCEATERACEVGRIALAFPKRNLTKGPELQPENGW